MYRWREGLLLAPLLRGGAVERDVREEERRAAAPRVPRAPDEVGAAVERETHLQSQSQLQVMRE